MKQKILDMVKRDHVSFAELSRIEGFAGDLEWSLPGNLVIWSGLSDAFLDAFESLRDDGLLHMVPCSQVIYLFDGVGLRLPVAKSSGPYKHPHWLPTVVRPGPPPRGKRARRA